MPVGSLRDQYVTLVDPSGNVISSTNPLNIGASAGSIQTGIASTTITTDAVLGANGVFDSTTLGGQYDDLASLGYPVAMVVSLHTDQKSAAIQVIWSRDGANVDIIDTIFANAQFAEGGLFGLFTGGVPTGLARSYDIPMRSFRYVKFLYTNGTTPQTIFHVRCNYYYSGTSRQLLHRLNPTTGIVEPQPSNAIYSLFSSAARTANVTTSLQVNHGFAGAIFSLIVSAVPASPGTGGLDIGLLIADSSGNLTRVNRALQAGTFVTTVGTFRWIWHPAASNMNTGQDSNAVKQLLGLPFPYQWGLSVLPQDAQSYTYAVQAAVGIF